MSDQAVEQRERDLLPTDAVPTHYTILLAPNLETFRFDGQETIDLQVRKTTSRIVLHSLDTDVDAASVSVQFGESEPLKASSVTKPNKETLLIEFPSELPLGVARLSLSFVFVQLSHDTLFIFGGSVVSSLTCAMLQWKLE